MKKPSQVENEAKKFEESHNSLRKNSNPFKKSKIDSSEDLILEEKFPNQKTNKLLKEKPQELDFKDSEITEFEGNITFNKKEIENNSIENSLMKEILGSNSNIF